MLPVHPFCAVNSSFHQAIPSPVRSAARPNPVGSDILRYLNPLTAPDRTLSTIYSHNFLCYFKYLLYYYIHTTSFVTSSTYTYLYVLLLHPRSSLGHFKYLSLSLCIVSNTKTCTTLILGIF